MTGIDVIAAAFFGSLGRAWYVRVKRQEREARGEIVEPSSRAGRKELMANARKRQEERVRQYYGGK